MKRHARGRDRSRCLEDRLASGPTGVALLALAGTAIAGALVATVRLRLVAVRVLGPSMSPSLLDGDVVLVARRSARRVRRGDVVVLRLPHRTTAADPWVVKRAVALPGDAVPREVPDVIRDARVPDGALVCYGDNRRFSTDSRAFGYFRADSLLGVVIGTVSLPSRPRGTAATTVG